MMVATLLHFFSSIFNSIHFKLDCVCTHLSSCVKCRQTLINRLSNYQQYSSLISLWPHTSPPYHPITAAVVRCTCSPSSPKSEVDPLPDWSAPSNRLLCPSRRCSCDLQYHCRPCRCFDSSPLEATAQQCHCRSGNLSWDFCRDRGVRRNVSTGALGMGTDNPSRLVVSDRRRD